MGEPKTPTWLLWVLGTFFTALLGIGGFLWTCSRANAADIRKCEGETSKDRERLATLEAHYTHILEGQKRIEDSLAELKRQLVVANRR